jgi:LPS-assembly protein
MCTRAQLQLRVDAFEGFFTDTRYQLLANGRMAMPARGFHRPRPRWCTRPPTPPARAKRATVEPDWILRADRIDSTRPKRWGARGAVLEFKGVPVLPVPAISFPLSDKRKSGCCRPPWARQHQRF